MAVIIEPDDTTFEHNVKEQIERSGFVPKVVITAEERDPRVDLPTSVLHSFQYKEEKTPKFQVTMYLKTTTEEKPIL